MRKPDWPCWPDLRLTIQVLPWHWDLKPSLYIDDVTGARGFWSFEWLMLTVEWWGPGADDEVVFPMEGD